MYTSEISTTFCTFWQNLTGNKSVPGLIFLKSSKLDYKTRPSYNENTSFLPWNFCITPVLLVSLLIFKKSASLPYAISPLPLKKGGEGGNYDTTTSLVHLTLAKFDQVWPCLMSFTYWRHTIIILYGRLVTNTFLIVSPTKICKSVSLCFTFGLISSSPGLSASY